MKNVKMNYRVMAFALLMAFSVAFSTSTLANDGNKNSPSIEIKFLGNSNNQPVFQLNLISAEKDEYTITIRDEAGYVLYSDVAKGDNITRKFRLSPETLVGNPLTVEIRSKSTKEVQVYEIGSTQKVVTETTVNKIK